MEIWILETNGDPPYQLLTRKPAHSLGRLHHILVVEPEILTQLIQFLRWYQPVQEQASNLASLLLQGSRPADELTVNLLPASQCGIE
ncbi:MAG: hypothetical protein AAGF24_00030 [Cyanobacteria bacterium P01_H01_bin.121]